MSHIAVDKGNLKTRYGGTPSVKVEGVPDGPVALELVYQVESTRAGSAAKSARIRFDGVLEYRWIASDQTYFTDNETDFTFELIEILDSGQVARMLDRGMYADLPAGQRLGGTVDEAHLRHFRIGFDDYGSFDVVCLRLEVEGLRSIS